MAGGVWVVESLEWRRGMVIECRHFSIKSRILKNQKVRVETEELVQMNVFGVQAFPNPPPYNVASGRDI